VPASPLPRSQQHVDSSCRRRAQLARWHSPSLPSGVALSAPWPVVRSRVCVAVPRAPLVGPSPLLQSLACADRAHARRDRCAQVASQRQTGIPTPFSSPCTPPPPTVSLISPLHTHPSYAHPFFKLAGASPSPGLLRPNPPSVELGHRPRPCSTTVRHSLTIVLAPPKVNFPAGPLFLPPPLFSLSRRLVAGDRRYRYHAVEPRSPSQLQPPRAFFACVESPAPAMALASCARSRKTAVLTRRTRPSASPLSASSFPSRGR
jgi:hypothetical protein